MAKVELPGVSAESQEMIEEQVKKGKPRKFFLVYKGASIKLLEVFKKGPFGPRVMKAKKDGFKGDVAYGLVTGSGKEICFQLAGNEEVAAAMKVESIAEKPPAETAKLRKFLTGNGLNLKPEYQIVTDPALVTDPEADSETATTSKSGSQAAPIGPPSTAAPPAPPPVTEAPEGPASDQTSTQQEAERPETGATPATTEQQRPEQQEDAGVLRRNALQTRFEQLQPRLTAAVSAYPEIAEDLQDLANEFVESMKIHDLDVAEEWLDKLADDLDELDEPAPLAADPSEAKFEARLKELAPVAVPIAKAGGERGAALAPLLKKLQTQRAGGDFAAGLETLAQIEQALPQAEDSAQNGSAEDPMKSFKSRLAALVPQIKQAAGTPAGDEAKQRASEAGDLARKNDFQQASLALDQVSNLLDGVLGDANREDAAALLAQAGARLLSDAQQAFADYLQMKPQFGSLEEIDASIGGVQRMIAKFNEDVGSRGSAESQQKLALLEAKVELQLKTIEDLRSHTAAIEELIQQIESTSDEEEAALLVSEFQEMVGN